MRPISQKIRKQIDELPFYKVCAKACISGHSCEGRITMEHAVEFAGRQLDALWAILPICSYGHGVDQFQGSGDINKEVHLWIALNRATTSELIMISKAVNYVKEKDRLNAKYGQWSEELAIAFYNARDKNAMPVELWHPIKTKEMKTLKIIAQNQKQHLGVRHNPHEIINEAIQCLHEKILDDIKNYAE